MAVTTAERPREYGVVSLDGDSVVAIEEKTRGPRRDEPDQRRHLRLFARRVRRDTPDARTGELAITATSTTWPPQTTKG